MPQHVFLLKLRPTFGHDVRLPGLRRWLHVLRRPTCKLWCFREGTCVCFVRPLDRKERSEWGRPAPVDGLAVAAQQAEMRSLDLGHLNERLVGSFIGCSPMWGIWNLMYLRHHAELGLTTFPMLNVETNPLRYIAYPIVLHRVSSTYF